MENERPDSQQLLRKLKYEEEQKQKKTRGKLKIFLGYAAGSGKTYTMLEAAHEALRHGVEVVAGYVEPHARPDTQALTEGIEMLPPMMVDYKGVKLREFDVDAALKRKPKLMLVDELAHTNAKGCRNEKRYQDVKELLRAGINVYTTLNIQHLESLNDLVGTITQIEVRERIPDRIFDMADQVEVIDIEPDELIERMKEGKIYGRLQAERALSNFFKREKLVALREITLRRVADRVNRIAEEERNALGNMEYHTGEHILACVSSAPSSAKVIRTASRLAYAFHAQFTVLSVETPELKQADEKTKRVLNRHLELARALGAKIVTVYGSDIAQQIAEYAIVGTRNSMQQIMLRFEQPLSGIWTVELQADFVLSGNIFCWLPLSQLLSGEVFFLRSDPNTTVTMPGMSRVAITTGAYQAIGGSIDPDSGRGFSSLDAVKPDIVAPGVNVLGPVLRDRYELRSGTSISAALTAGACAQLFQWGIVENNMLYLNTTDLKNLLIRGAVRDEDRTYPNPVYGYGVLEVYQALSRLRGN